MLESFIVWGRDYALSSSFSIRSATEGAVGAHARQSPLDLLHGAMQTTYRYCMSFASDITVVRLGTALGTGTAAQLFPKPLFLSVQIYHLFFAFFLVFSLSLAFYILFPFSTYLPLSLVFRPWVALPPAQLLNTLTPHTGDGRRLHLRQICVTNNLS